MTKFYYIILGIIIIAIAVFCYTNLTFTEIYVNDKLASYAPTRIEAKKWVKKVISEKKLVSPDVMVNDKITYKRGNKNEDKFKIKTVDGEIITDKDINREHCKTLLQEAITAQVPCTIIVVNGEPLLGLPTKDNAGEFLIAVKDKYKLPGCEEPEIKENITIDNSAIDIKKHFRTVDKAIDYISHGKRKITVVVRKPFNKEVIVPQKTVKVSSTKIPFGKQKVISKGSPGKKIVTGYTIFENGKKVREETTKEEFLLFFKKTVLLLDIYCKIVYNIIRDTKFLKARGQM